MTNKLSKHAGGGEIYSPGMLAYDGASSFTIASITTSGNVVQGVVMFAVDSFDSTVDSIQYLMRVMSGGYIRCGFSIISNDYVVPELRDRIRFVAHNNTGTLILDIASETLVTDGEIHTIHYKFNATTGEASLVVDGNQEDYLGYGDRDLTTGTLPVGTSDVWIGATVGGANLFFTGSQGYVGYTDGDVSEYADHFINGTPKEYDFSSWLIANPHGDMENNYGTAGNLTKAGTIVVSDLGQTVNAGLGLNTIGDATPADIAEGKIAWVDGEEIVGTSGPVFHQSGPHSKIHVDWTLPEGDGTTTTVDPADSAQILNTDVAVSPRTGVLDVVGYLQPATAYYSAFYVGGLPDPAVWRHIHYEVRCLTGSPTAWADHRMHFNYIDSNNYWMALVSWDGSKWNMHLYERTGGIQTLRGSASLYNYGDMAFKCQISYWGDSVHFTVHNYSRSSTYRFAGDGITYTTTNRPHKTAHGIVHCNANNTEFGWRSIRIGDE